MSWSLPSVVRSVALLCPLWLSAAAAAQPPHGAAPPPDGPPGQFGPPEPGLPRVMNMHRRSDDDPGITMTTDTLPWCRYLAGSFETFEQHALQPHPEAAALARRGADLCARGRLREGILSLRHALLRLAGP